MNRVVISEGVRDANGAIAATGAQSIEQHYDGRGLLTAEYSQGCWAMSVTQAQGAEGGLSTYGAPGTFGWKRYGYDGMGRLKSTDTDLIDYSQDTTGVVSGSVSETR